MNGKRQRLFVTIGEASRFSDLEAQTIRKMADKASFICYKTPSRQRKINIRCIQELCNNFIHDKEKSIFQKGNSIHLRVFTKKQMDDLSRQLEYIKRQEHSN